MKAPRRVRVTLEDGTSVLVPPSVTPKTPTELHAQVVAEIEKLVRRDYEQVGSGYMSSWEMVKEPDGDYVLFDDVVSAIAKALGFEVGNV